MQCYLWFWLKVYSSLIRVKKTQNNARFDTAYLTQIFPEMFEQTHFWQIANDHSIFFASSDWHHFQQFSLFRKAYTQNTSFSQSFDRKWRLKKECLGHNGLSWERKLFILLLCYAIIESLFHLFVFIGKLTVFVVSASIQSYFFSVVHFFVHSKRWFEQVE